MANDCYIWFRVTASSDSIDKIINELRTVGFNGSYGYSSIERKNDTCVEVYGTTKWHPPVETFNKWLNVWSDTKIECLFKEEFLQFAGRWISDNEDGGDGEYIDFKQTSSRDVRNADSGLLYELEKKLYLADQMENHRLNDHYEDNLRLLG